MMKRNSGVLLNVSSLPGEFGIGGFSREADMFLEDIASMGFHWWQTLPLTTIGLGDSPYAGFSAFAGNYLYIDPYNLPKGLLTDDEIQSFKSSDSYYLVDYARVRESKRRMLKLAYSRVNDEIRNKLKAFRAEHSDWLIDYALFMALKDFHGGKAWTEWSAEYRDRDKNALNRFSDEHAEEVEYYVFEQYEFFRQWFRVKKAAESYNVGIFGDMPIYLILDSADVWAHRKLFQLDSDGKALEVAGVPPDYFAKDGQLWGNPLYDWDAMKSERYQWFIRRIKHNLSMYDALRIDHFRGLLSYWSVPAGAKTAKEGKWVKGPGLDLWKEVKKKLGSVNVVAEDLGIIDKDVVEFVDATGFPGMKVMQFGFDGRADNPHLPHNFDKNCVAYSGTHDNDTTLGWFYSLDNETRTAVLDYIDCSDNGWGMGGGNCPSIKAFIRCLCASSANLVIVPLQDLCGYGSDTRMNTPGVGEGNWRYRTNVEALSSINWNFYRRLNEKYGRNNNIF